MGHLDPISLVSIFNLLVITIYSDFPRVIFESGGYKVMLMISVMSSNGKTPTQ